MNIAFLDNQLLKLIRNHLTMRTTQGVDIARAIDNQAYTPSNILALLDDSLAKRLHTDDTLTLDLKEIGLLEKFYKKALPDNSFILENQEKWLSSFFYPAHSALSRCLPFIFYLQQCLADLEKVQDKEKLLEEIFITAAQYHVEAGNPLIIIAMCALYGHPLAKVLIQPQANQPSTKKNFLTDAQLNMINIFILPSLVSAYSKQSWEASGTQTEIDYTLLTPEPALNELVASLQIKGQALKKTDAQGGETIDCVFDIGLSTDMFPEIADNSQKMDNLISHLTSS